MRLPEEPCSRATVTITPGWEGVSTGEAGASSARFALTGDCPSCRHTRTMTAAVMAMASTSAMGAAQKIPVTPQKTGATSESAIRNRSRSSDSGAAAFAFPMDCRKIAQTFCVQVSRMQER